MFFKISEMILKSSDGCTEIRLSLEEAEALYKELSKLYKKKETPYLVCEYFGHND